MWPEIAEWAGLIESGDALGLERAISALCWDRFGRLAQGHYFDFEAVAFYFVSVTFLETLFKNSF